MSIKTLKSTFRRSGLLVAAFALVAATVLPAASTYADALNPLTERSLTLSSGSPGWNYKDASGNATYAPPNSGANGKQSGNTFTFRVSSSEALSGMTFQYCTTPAGDCMGPGDIPFTGSAGSYARASNADAEASKKSDLEVVLDPTTGGIISQATFNAKFNANSGQPASYTPLNGYDPDTIHPNMPKLDGTEGNFIVLHKSTALADWEYSPDWTMVANARQTVGGSAGTLVDGTSTGKNNFIKLSNATTPQALSAGDYVKVIFFATNTSYITNPGSKEFFVKINTYKDPTTESDATLVDGGVTVANVMNRSIEIQTKVLETMQFSVGTVDPNTLDTAGGQFAAATGSAQHSTCDPVVQGMTTGTTTPNVLQLGDQTGEFSLRTDTTYSTHSYWRLSSNSSGGATVYYSGVTLSNTVGDQIRPIGKTAAAPQRGGEQFGLALDNGKLDPTNNPEWKVSYDKERTANYLYQNGADNAVGGLHPSTTTANTGNASWHEPRLSPLTPAADYDGGTGTVNVAWQDPEQQDPGTSIYGESLDTSFAFDPDSNTIPTPIASGTQVLDCVTGKMRYIANIAATTPAGIYTTKINYIAAPKY